jgi:hypothetical protein
MPTTTDLLSAPTRVVIIYSHEDAEWLTRLQRMLQPLDREGIIGLWNDTSIVPGTPWEEEIRKSLEAAKVAVLLVSQAFLNSDFIRKEELPILLDAASKRRTAIVPVILDHNTFTAIPKLQRFQTFNDPQEPLNHCNPEAQEHALKRLAELILDKFVSSPLPLPPEPSLLTTESQEGARPRLLRKALPLDGATRLVYTCRSSFGQFRFRCPNAHSSYRQPLVVSTHLPIDEIETSALMISTYGEELFGLDERNAQSAITCSEGALKALCGSRPWIPKDSGDIDTFFLGNLIIIGENRFSNTLSYVYLHYLPWQYLILHERPMERIYPGEPHFVVRPFLNSTYYESRVTELLECISFDGYERALLTFAPNPFMPDKRILWLPGCNRAGQYLLSSWLKDRVADEALTAIAERQATDPPQFLQVLVKGKPTSATPGHPVRKWSLSTIEKLSLDNISVPFFGPPTPQGHFASQWDADISDLSLLGLVEPDDDLVKSIVQTLPPALRGLATSLHVTLYEFLHIEGWQYHGLLDKFLSGELSFLERLRTLFLNSPAIHMVARQTRVTQTSLQVLVDVYSEVDDIVKFRGRLKGTETHALDVIARNCTEAKSVLSDDICRTFNVNAILLPLHMTLVRFGAGSAPEHRNAAKRWADDYKRRIWGKALDLKIVLSGARKFPFQAVEMAPVRPCDTDLMKR